MKTEDIVPRLLNLFRDNFGSYFNEYYEGDPGQIPNSAFPCLIVQKKRARIELDATGTDRLESEVVVSIVYDKRKDYGARGNQALTEQLLREKVEGRDPETGAFLPTTVMYVLRKNITLGQTKLSLGADWEYNFVERDNDVLTSEATIELLATERIIASARE